MSHNNSPIPSTRCGSLNSVLPLQGRDPNPSLADHLYSLRLPNQLSSPASIRQQNPPVDHVPFQIKNDCHPERPEGAEGPPVAARSLQNSVYPSHRHIEHSSELLAAYSP